MKKVPVIDKERILVLIYMVIALSYAAQNDIITINATSLEKLVNVTADIDFDKVLPNSEYSTDITVKWAVPDSALQNINEKVVYVYVGARPRQNNTLLLFQKGNETFKEFYLALRCVIENGTCVNGSVLQDSFKVKLTAIENMTLDDAVLITASTTQNRTNEIYKEKITLEAIIAELEDVQSLNSSDLLEVKELVNEAKDDLELLHIDDANQKLDSAQEIISRSNFWNVGNIIPKQDLLVPVVAILVVLCGAYFFLKPRK